MSMKFILVQSFVFQIGTAVLSERTSCWCPVGCVGQEVLPRGDSVLHVRSDSFNSHQHMVVFRYDFH